MHGYICGKALFYLGIFTIIYTMYVWWRDIVREGTYEGQHTKAVQSGLRMGVLLFIFSEVLFFVAFFWGFFHSSLNPSPFIGGVWIPRSEERRLGTECVSKCRNEWSKYH